MSPAPEFRDFPALLNYENIDFSHYFSRSDQIQKLVICFRLYIYSRKIQINTLLTEPRQAIN